MNAPHMAHFTVAYWCVFVAALLPLLCAVIAKRGGVGKRRSEGGYDNHDPRAWLARQSGAAARANAAQANSFEALPFFIGAVVIAHQLGAGQTALDLLALLYVMLRLFYIMMYVSDMPMARSLVWGAAFLVNIGIFFIGYR
ncbi:MAPEG family protein [Simplicispira lacusdiani]|uniref:MAPEG family protein n=1 Tax=Simplicispira lacusdiani TaxID=2213010 RepID=UPI0018E59C61|nr:MAPEG family protein [Simplicispira lacusdiani]